MPKPLRTDQKPTSSREKPAPIGPTYARISDLAVTRATGKTWAHWLGVLDRFDVKTHGHAAAAEHLGGRHGVGPWWRQMVVVGYEQARGLRVRHQKPAGFSVSSSRVLACSARRAFRAWQPPERGRWLPDPGFVTRKQTSPKSIRITWIDGKTSVDVMFYPKGPDKCSVSVQHDKLASAAAAKRMKKYWSAALDALRATLEH